MGMRRGGHAAKRKPSLGVQLLLSAFVGLLLGSLFLYWLNTRLQPAVIAIAMDHLSNQISGEICQVVEQELEARQLSYDSICTLQRNEDGSIAALQSNMVLLTGLQSALTTQVAAAFDSDLVNERVEIPIGSLLPGYPFSGRGPHFTVEILAVGNISAQFENEFYADGINQTIHRVVLQIDAELTLLLPGGVCNYTDETSVILAETVLLGQVPEYYVSVSGTTDEN
jgi:sporulation protein YunB